MVTVELRSSISIVYAMVRHSPISRERAVHIAMGGRRVRLTRAEQIAGYSTESNMAMSGYCSI